MAIFILRYGNEYLQLYGVRPVMLYGKGEVQ